MYASGSISSAGRITITNRADVATSDFDKDDFSDGWQDLDLSGIIPVGTKLVILDVRLKSSAGLTAVTIRTKGHTNAHNRHAVVLQTVNIESSGCICKVPDVNRCLELYRGAGVTWTVLNVTVTAWFV